MRRLLSSLAAVSLLTAQAAQAQLECLSPTERSAVQVAALRSQLMVLGDRLPGRQQLQRLHPQSTRPT